MENIGTILSTLRASDRIRVHPSTTQPRFPKGVVPPGELLEFYRICGGLDFLDAEDGTYARYRIVRPEEVTDIGTATSLEAATEPPLSDWFVVGEDDNAEHVAIDVHPSRSGQCYDVFHETYWDPSSAMVVAESFGEFLIRLFERGESYWLKEDFTGRYFDDGADEREV